MKVMIYSTRTEPVFLARRPYVEPIGVLSFGPMNIKCDVCGIFHWFDERVKASSTSCPRFSQCHHHGQVRLDPLPDPP